MRAHTTAVLKNKNVFETAIVAVDERKTKFVHANKWAARMVAIKKACNKRTDEEIRLYECVALTSWESS